MSINISIQRSGPEKGGEPVWVDYTVPGDEHTTVLEALMHIYEHTDSTLAFRSGCRFDTCGLCAVEVNGRPSMGCFTEIKDGIKIGPLGGIPVVRDLVIDRAGFFNGLRELDIYIPEQEGLTEPQIIRQPHVHQKLLGCVECLACNATCPEYDFDRNPLAGPYVYVKLAQLHFDPRNKIDRRGQARELGVDACAECRKCYCIHGINIRKHAIEVLASR
jgi:succinate dehydrogenase/fumarate reductase iron-sulfur protein